LTTVTEAYTDARKAATAAEAAGTAGVELSTEAVKKSRAAIIAHPILGGIAAAITIAVAALAAWINHLEKEAKAAKEAAEASNVAAQERAKIV
jgi:orotate phosphoribosyltransferase